MIELDDRGENYRIVWGLVNGGRPTSESTISDVQWKFPKNLFY